MAERKVTMYNADIADILLATIDTNGNVKVFYTAEFHQTEDFNIRKGHQI